MPLIDKYWGPHGMKSWNVTQFPPINPLDCNPHPYVVITTILWEKLEQLQNALAAPETNETRADIAKFSTVQPHIWFNEVVATQDL